MILQRITIIVGDAVFEPGTFMPIWSTFTVSTQGSTIYTTRFQYDNGYFEGEVGSNLFHFFDKIPLRRPLQQIIFKIWGHNENITFVFTSSKMSSLMRTRSGSPARTIG